MCPTLATSDPTYLKNLYLRQAEEDIRLYGERLEEQLSDSDPAQREALAVRMIQDMIAEIDYEIIVDLGNAAYWQTMHEGHNLILDRFVGEWMVKQSEEEQYKYDPAEGF